MRTAFELHLATTMWYSCAMVTVSLANQPCAAPNWKLQQSFAQLLKHTHKQHMLNNSRGCLCEYMTHLPCTVTKQRLLIIMIILYFTSPMLDSGLHSSRIPGKTCHLLSTSRSWLVSMKTASGQGKLVLSPPRRCPQLLGCKSSPASPWKKWFRTRNTMISMAAQEMTCFPWWFFRRLSWCGTWLWSRRLHSIIIMMATVALHWLMCGSLSDFCDEWIHCD